MKSGTMYEQRDIVIVPFPFSDLSAVKHRPVLIISNNKDNKESEDIVTCGITSNLNNAKHSVLIENNNLELGYIPSKSRIKVDKLFTLDKSIIIKRVAKINNETLDKVKKEFINII